MYDELINAFIYGIAMGIPDRVKYKLKDEDCIIYFLDQSPSKRVLVKWNEDWQYWFFNGKLHRDDGPAILDYGDRYWYKHGVWHREDGPAVQWSSGPGEYYLEGKSYSEGKYWKKIRKLKYRDDVIRWSKYKEHS